MIPGWHVFLTARIPCAILKTQGAMTSGQLLGKFYITKTVTWQSGGFAFLL